MERAVVLSNLPTYPSKWSLQKALETECGIIIETIDINPDDKSEAVIILKRKEDRAVINERLKHFIAQITDPHINSARVVIKQEFQGAEAPSEPCPIPMQKPIYYSYFEKYSNGSDDEVCSLEEARKLKHLADDETCIPRKVMTYLESALYFMLQGILFEEKNSEKCPFTMFTHIFPLLRNVPVGDDEESSASKPSSSAILAAKIDALSFRCKSLLSLKLFRMKFSETKELALELNCCFHKNSKSQPSVADYPKDSAESVDAAAKSPIVFKKMDRYCSQTMYIIKALDWWQSGDNLVEKYHIQDFFVSIDRCCGPLTLNSSLKDLVRYARYALRELSRTSECENQHCCCYNNENFGEVVSGKNGSSTILSGKKKVRA